jgi:hypothetical protein
MPGPAASGDHNTLAGVIDTPSADATLTLGQLQLSGWFVDLTAQGWAGADDVEIFMGTMDSGRPLAHAQFGQSRPDVAAALHNGYWAQSGWSASAATDGLTPGPATLSVYVHTPAKGWWFRQVNIVLRQPPPPPQGTPATVQPSSTQTSIYGNDIASPQCPTGAEPKLPAFAIVGVNGGRPFTANPCLPRQFTWALTSTSPSQAHLAFYMNTANPGPSASGNWPVAGTSTPRACDGSWSQGCAYDYGWLSAQDAYGRGLGVAGNPTTARLPWWLDVESANSWSSDTSINAADVQGAIEFLHAQQVGSIGIYSTSADWEAIVGPPSTTNNNPFGSLLNWQPGPSTAQDAPAWCSRTVTGARVKFVQFPSGGFDTDLACF